jgi:hypothetical protein
MLFTLNTEWQLLELWITWKGVQNDRKDANVLENNPSVLMASLVFRFQIAGYNCNSSWFTNAGVCNFASAPTLEILVPLPPNQLDECE